MVFSVLGSVAHAAGPVATSSNGIQIAGDYNGDGALDLAIVNPGYHSVSVILGNRDGTFLSPQSFAVGNRPAAIVNGDFNVDGKLDLAITNSADNTVTILFGVGDGTFAAGGTYATGVNPQGITTADFNGDGFLDLAVVNNGGSTVGVFLSVGGGTFGTQVIYPVGRGHSTDGIATGDFNGDGKVDLAVVNNSEGTVSALMGVGDGTFLGQKVFAVGNSKKTTGGVATGDFNGDGKSDIAVVNSDDATVSVLLASPTTVFHPQIAFAVQDFTGSGGIAIADFDADGSLDLAVVNPGTQSVSVLLGRGNGAFDRQKVYKTGLAPFPRSVAVGDFDGDGYLDLVAVGATHAVATLYGNGSGTFNLK